MMRIKHRGDFKKTLKFLKKCDRLEIENLLEKYGRIGVEALSRATPLESGETSESWYYKIERRFNGYAIVFCNSNFNKYAQIAVLVQYGHAARDGSWVEGTDYINPALRPIFEDIAETIWREIKNA